MAYDFEAFLDAECTISGWYPPSGWPATWRIWLGHALETLLEEGEGFSGKRPNCDSGWELSFEQALCLANPKVADADAYRRYLDARAEESQPDYEGDWESDDHDMVVYKSLDRSEVAKTRAALIKHLVFER